MKIVDMHCDTISRIFEEREKGEQVDLRKNSLHLDLCRMQGAGYLLQNFALFVDRSQCRDVTEQAKKLLALYEEELLRNKDLTAPVYRFSDIEENQERGRMSALLTLEEGGILKGSRELLKDFYEKGVRMITLTWNYPNEIGYPNGEAGGLTPVGRELVEAMEEMGVIVDVSHLSDAGFYEVAELTRKPFVASHSNSRRLCAAPRNLTDDMIRILGERGGVTGLNFYPAFLTRPAQAPLIQAPLIQGGKNPGTIADVAAHARHIVNVGGMEVLGLGSDFDGISGNEELPGVQAVPRLADALKKEGFHASEIDKIFGGNVLRVYRETL